MYKLNFIVGIYVWGKNSKYRDYVPSAVSDIHWGPWNIPAHRGEGDYSTLLEVVYHNIILGWLKRKHQQNFK